MDVSNFYTINSVNLNILHFDKKGKEDFIMMYQLLSGKVRNRLVFCTICKCTCEFSTIIQAPNAYNLYYIQNSKFLFRSNIDNSTDYHNKMNLDLFKSWFITMINNLEEPYY